MTMETTIRNQNAAAVAFANQDPTISAKVAPSQPAGSTNTSGNLSSTARRKAGMK